MGLNSSGPISLAGTTTGQSIEVELGGNGTTAISLNDASVRTLAGVPSGAITMPTNFWGKSNDNTFWVGGFSGVYGQGTTTDTSNNNYMIGSYTPYYYYGTIAKYNITGTLQFQEYVGTGSTNLGASYTATDSSGNLITTGYNAYPQVACTIKFNSSGAIVWQTGYGSGNDCSGNGLAIDSSNNIYVGGSGSNLVTGAPYPQGFLVKYDSSGNIQWQRNIYQPTGDYQQVYPIGVMIDTAGYIVSSGRNTIYGTSVFKYDSSGNLQYQKYINASNGVGNIARDSSNNYYIVVGTPSGFALIKTDSSVNIQWARQLSGGTSTSGGSGSVTVDSSNNIYVSGYANISGQNRGILAKYNTSGTIQWQRQFYNTSISFYSPIYNISVSSTGSVYVNFQGSYSGAAFSLFAKIPPDGSRTGSYTISGIGTSLNYDASGLVDASASYSSGNTTFSTGTPTVSASSIGASVTSSGFSNGIQTI